MDDEKNIETPEDMPEGEELEEEVEQEQEQEEEEQQEDEEIDVDAIKVEIREKAREEEIDYGEDIDPEDVKTIGTIVQKQTASDRAAQQAITDKLEVTEFIQENPQFSKYKNVMLKYMKESPDVYGRLPVKNVAAIAAANDLIKLGAKKEREAQIKADSSKTTGSPARKPNAGQTDWSKAPKEDFEAQKRRVLGQG